MSMKNQFEDIIDFQQFLLKIARNWFLVIVSLLLALIVAFAINRYSHEKYYSETSILIKENNNTLTPSDLLYENPVNSKKKSLENKALILRSYPLLYKTVKDLNFNIGYYIVGNIMVTETYISPVILESNDTEYLTGKSILINIINASSYSLMFEGE